ncbi:MAG: hypothetical protein CVV21_09305 [Candidatus Goldiibacteriota bacterium HGW-Goldbacteria-1]|jgi:HD-GYP domain-containing protein (c-di-GMP phosphodiesterase class II)|nr:MAG: hypothetical protein CVV21_09305 [Candidatus Goldiibacteriota bacterium HGW-Goldbacteria-1]
MLRTRVSELTGGEINVLMAYTYDGRELIRQGVEITPRMAEKLREQKIGFVYADGPVTVSAVFDRNIISGLHKVIACFVESGGNDAEILRKYNDTEIKSFLSVNNETGKSIAYGHIMKYFAGKMYDALRGRTGIVYDFVDYRGAENYFIFHMVNVCCMCMATAQNMGLDGASVIDIGIGTMLYDYQMQKMDFSMKNEILKTDEMEKIKEHTVNAHRYLRSVYGIPSRSSAIALQHHERHDGSGYPGQLKGGGILLLSRIAAVCDVYDSMVSQRQHRPAYNPEEAWDYIKINSGVIFDPETVSVFLRTVPKYMPGDIVHLACEKYGLVVKNNSDRPENPDIIIIEKTLENDIIGMKIEKKSDAVAAEGDFQILKTTARIR